MQVFSYVANKVAKKRILLEEEYIIESDDMDDWVKSTTLLATFGASDNIVLILKDIIHAAGCSDLQYNKLINTIQNRF